MGILHRLYARNAQEVWQVETRLLHALGRVRRPLAVQWVVTSACDLHCPHCYSEAGKRTVGELTTDEAKRLIVDELAALGCRNLVLAGGELWLRRDISEIIAYAASRGLSWSMHTHGLHVPKFREVLRRHPPVLAAISLDDVGEAHDAFRGKEGSFAGALAAIRLLKDVGCPEVVAGTTVTRRNADRLGSLFPVVVASGADAWGLHLFAPEGRGHAHLDLVPTPEQLRRVAAYARAKRRLFHVELCNEWGSAGTDDLLYRDQPFLCGAGRVSCVVSATGEIMPCTTTDVRESEGNVREIALSRVWASGFQRFRRPRTGARRPAPRSPALLWPRAKGTPPPPQVSPSSDDDIDEQECWLQSRNGNACSAAAFGNAKIPSPSLVVERILASPLLETLRSTDAPRVVSKRAARAIRVAAVSAIFLQGCANKIKAGAAAAVREPPTAASASSATASAPPVPTSPVLSSISFPDRLGTKLALHFALQSPRSSWKRALRTLAGPDSPTLSTELKGSLDALERGNPEGAGLLSARLSSHATRREQGRADSALDLISLLDAAEALPVYDPAFVGYLWKRSQPATDAASRLALYRRLYEHLRIVSSLRAAEAVTGKVELSAWRSKAAPPPDFEGRVLVPAGLLAAAKSALPTTSAEEWARSAALSFTLLRGELSLHRPGKAERVALGKRFALGRLDLIASVGPCTISHPALGEIVLPAATEASLLDLSGLLSAAVDDRLRGLVTRTALGERPALTELSPLVAAAHAHIRARLKEHPGEPGSGALEMLLATLDE